MEGEMQPLAAAATIAPAAEAFAVSKVLDDNDLLIEILLRISFPTTLVCKRWLHHASGRKFLRRFRELHPPRLLGFYHNRSTSPRFVPMPHHPPELAAVIRRSSFSLDDDSQSADVWTFIMDSRDMSGQTLGVRSVLCPARVVPPFPRDKPQDGYLYTHNAVHSMEDVDVDGDGLSHFFLYMESCSSTIAVHLYALQAGVWRTHTSTTTHNCYFLGDVTSVLAGNKIYFTVHSRKVLVLDLTTSSFSTILLPPGVMYEGRYTALSRADNYPGVFLVHSNERHQLGIWLRNGDYWLSVDHIDLPGLYARLVMSDDTLDTCVDVRISHVGDNAEFMFLEMGPCILHLDVKSRTLRKVYEMEEERYLGRVYPLMMTREYGAATPHPCGVIKCLLLFEGDMSMLRRGKSFDVGVLLKSVSVGIACL